MDSPALRALRAEQCRAVNDLATHSGWSVMGACRIVGVPLTVFKRWKRAMGLSRVGTAAKGIARCGACGVVKVDGACLCPPPISVADVDG